MVWRFGSSESVPRAFVTCLPFGAEAFNILDILPHFARKNIEHRSRRALGEEER